MEDFLDPFLLSPSWTELNAPATSSWNGTVSSQTNGLLAVPIDAYAEDEKSPAVRMIPSSHIMGNIATENMDENSGTLKYMSEHELANSNSHFCQNENEIQESNFSLNEVYESNSISGSYGQDLNTPHSALTMSSSIESSGSEPCKFAQSLTDANSISSVSSMWPPSYSGVSSFVEQGKLQGFNFQDTDNDKYLNMNSSAAAPLQDGNGLHSPIFPNYNLAQQIKAINGGFHSHKQEQNGMHNLQFPTFSAGPPLMPVKSAEFQAHEQSSEANNMKHQVNYSSGAQQAPPANTTGCNGAAKPRVRARRGQATDPHSIAERLRREKIAERMKNLQELVPNSDKTDKASMLDEIIDYVKFLQLQVKVLSMSRLGAAGAVVPLITDAQSEASSLHLSSSGQGGTDVSEAQDNLAFEQEVVKLMESNVTTAMQFLQNKGLCLMPIALASAISSHKGSYSAAIPQDKDKRKPNGSNVVLSRENEVHNINCNGESVKQEEPAKY